VQLPIFIPLRKSSRLLAILWLAHVLAAMTLVPLGLPDLLRAFLFWLVILSLFLTLRRQRRQSVVGLQLGATGELGIERKVGAGGTAVTAIETAVIAPHTAILPGLIVLLMHCGEQRIALPLLADSMDPDLNRQLRLWLQWACQNVN
jgi:toxin CptA